TQHRAPTTPPYWPAYWPVNLRRLAHQYYPEVFARPLPGAAVAFVFDAQDSVIGHATGVREAGDGDCLAVVDRLVPAFHTSSWSLGGCADFANRAVVVSWKVLKQVRSEEHTSELQSRFDLVCRLLLEKKKHDKVQNPSSKLHTT